MSAAKIIAIVVLVIVGAHLLLFGFLRRMIAQAKADAERATPDTERRANPED